MVLSFIFLSKSGSFDRSCWCRLMIIGSGGKSGKINKLRLIFCIQTKKCHSTPINSKIKCLFSSTNVKIAFFI